MECPIVWGMLSKLLFNAVFFVRQIVNNQIAHRLCLAGVNVAFDERDDFVLIGIDDEVVRRFVNSVEVVPRISGAVFLFYAD